MIRGLYIHIPFCNLKCPYCDFTSFVWQEEDLKIKYLDFLKREISLYKDLDFNLETIYFGGGTPSVIKSKNLASFIRYLKDDLKVCSNLEITIEVNPKTYDYNDFKILKEVGVNRVSIGNQSFLEKNLISLGRDHKSIDSFKTIENCLKAGIDNINLDLIYGIENQTLKDLEEDLKIYTSLDIKHISAYLLTAYEDTPLGLLVEKGSYNLPDEDTTYRMFLMIDETLSNKGFKRYELSNWAKESFECKHNLFYWKDVNFLGIGISAWSYVENERFGNTKNINEYFSLIEEFKKPVKFREILDEEEKRKEKIFLGLRLREGVDLDILKDKRDIIYQFIDEGYGNIENNKFFLLPKGIMVINKIVSILI